VTLELNGRKVIVTDGKWDLDRTIAETVADVDTGVEGRRRRIETAAAKNRGADGVTAARWKIVAGLTLAPVNGDT
jgi:hypothetical protein